MREGTLWHLAHNVSLSFLLHLTTIEDPPSEQVRGVCCYTKGW